MSSEFVLPTLAWTTDAFLGGRVSAIQPLKGHHRAGLDAVLLAAAIEPRFAGQLLDLGAGVGVAGMAVAARAPLARVSLVERDREALHCARAALQLEQNRGFAARVNVVAADIADAKARAAAGLSDETADAVIMNPPFFAPGSGTAPMGGARAAAYVQEAGGIDPWIRAAAALLRPRGSLAVIYRPEGLTSLLAALDGRFGEISVLPIAPRPGAPAGRVLVAGRKGSRAPLALLAPFALHGESSNAFLPTAQAILRAGASLGEVHPSWAGIGRAERSAWPFP
jgi:tRNA1(Val) A37 N6-methylase TrmN6